MAEYHIGCGAFAIYAETLNSKNKSMWKNKTKDDKAAVLAYGLAKLREEEH